MERKKQTKNNMQKVKKNCSASPKSPMASDFVLGSSEVSAEVYLQEDAIFLIPCGIGRDAH
jgi:hypothetical protein